MVNTMTSKHPESSEMVVWTPGNAEGSHFSEYIRAHMPMPHRMLNNMYDESVSHTLQVSEVAYSVVI